MSFVRKFEKTIDVFKFYEGKNNKQFTLNAYVLNKQLKNLIENDKIVYNNILYLDYLLSISDELKPKKEIDEIYNEYLNIRHSKTFESLFKDYGYIKKWENFKEK